jgi:hypothetical protein
MPTLIEYNFVNYGLVMPRRGSGWFARNRAERLYVHTLTWVPGQRALPFSFRLPASTRQLHSLTVCATVTAPATGVAWLGRLYAEADKRRATLQVPVPFGGPASGQLLSFWGGNVGATQELHCPIANPLIEGVFLPMPLPEAVLASPFTLYLVFDYSETAIVPAATPEAHTDLDAFIAEQIQTPHP